MSTAEYLRNQKHLLMFNKTQAEVKAAVFIYDILQKMDNHGEIVNDFACRRTDITSYLGLSESSVVH